MTQHYVGTKIIEAWPVEKDGQLGYGVKYPDGYLSWSPATAFEAAYLPLGHIGGWPPHVQRMIAEAAELANKLAKLDAFISKSVSSAAFAELTAHEKGLLIAQHRFMSAYLDTLRRRIAWATALTDADAAADLAGTPRPDFGGAIQWMGIDPSGSEAPQP